VQVRKNRIQKTIQFERSKKLEFLLIFFICQKKVKAVKFSAKIDKLNTYVCIKISYRF